MTKQIDFTTNTTDYNLLESNASIKAFFDSHKRPNGELHTGFRIVLKTGTTAIDVNGDSQDLTNLNTYDTNGTVALKTLIIKSTSIVGTIIFY